MTEDSTLLRIRRELPDVGVLVLSQYVEKHANAIFEKLDLGGHVRVQPPHPRGAPLQRHLRPLFGQGEGPVG